MYSAIQFNSVNDPLPDILYGKLKFLYFSCPSYLREREGESICYCFSQNCNWCSCTFLIIFILKSTWLPRKYIHLLEIFLHPRILDNPQNEVDSLPWISFFCALIGMKKLCMFVFENFCFFFILLVHCRWDIIAERLGFMLVFGDLVWIPFTFSIQARDI